MLETDVSASAAAVETAVAMKADGTAAPPRPLDAHRPGPMELRLRVIDADVLAELWKPA